MTNTDKGSFFMEHTHPRNSLLLNSIRTAICGGVFLTQAHAALVINEVDYDQPGTDQGEFIELFNSGTDDILLDGVTLDLINGTNGSAYRSFDLAGLTIGADAYLVLCDGASSVVNCNLEVSASAGWLQNGGALAAHLTATPDLYGVDLERGIAELVAEATSFRFDASDLMPSEVGSGSFWTGMVDYVSGAADLDTVLKEIDASWPNK